MMADMHAITVRQNPADLDGVPLLQLAQYIACGLDPKGKHNFYSEPRTGACGAFMGVELLHDVWRAFQNDAV